MIKRAILTGATGAIGTALIEELIEQNVEVTVLVRGNSQRANQVVTHPLVKKEICSLEQLKDFSSSKTYDAFFHLAWQGTFGEDRNNMDLQLQNVQYALDAVDCAKRLGCQVFVGVGSQAEYGKIPDGTKLSATTPCNPQTGYGIAKFTAGKMTKEKCRQYGIRHVWGRILSSYGPGDQPATLVMSSIIRFANGEDADFTKGEQMWDYLYSGDVAKALYLMSEKGIDGKVYPIGSGVVKPLCEWITAIRNCVNPKCKLNFGAIPYYPNQVMYLCADIEELKQDTGFVPTVEFSQGIQKTYSWYKENQK